ncbi:MAG: hypothetical protein OHK0012_18550 [Synechococcales cyanobacterium]
MFDLYWDDLCMGNYQILRGVLLASLSGSLWGTAVAAPNSPWQSPSLATTDAITDVVAALPDPEDPADRPLDLKSVSDDLSQARIMPASFGTLSPVLKVGTPRSQVQEQSVTTLYEHQMDGKPSTTIYLRDLPLVTFVKKEGQPAPLLQASSLAAQLNQMARTTSGTQDVTLEYRDSHYVMMHNGEELVRFDDNVLTMGKDQASLALTATNRLRRLLLDAPPLAAAPQPPAPPAPLNPFQQAVSNLVGLRPTQEQRGQASFYTFAPKSPTHGLMTAAHRSLPFGTMVRVTNLANGQATVVKINDRGPFIAGRIIDLSYAAARAIGMVQAGVVPVKVEVLGRN